MTAMVITVVAFALINYALKAIGPVFLPDRELPRAVSLLINALPLALLCGMLVTSVVGDAGANLDLSLLVGLAAATVAWALRAGHLTCVATCAGVTIVCRLLV
ncbi:AzlD domain-containing protein [Nocardioides sp.]|uniref:AzlD domain-containing protein n=1 Tax=Nocardioides sp. TaxID=35761 RepID=UPI002735C0A0|nr:AzlD domain-containing protein [Nocardioides sp.]MDP3890818.1 AzlD domain-containing protein [Nocardioides sp.]